MTENTAGYSKLKGDQSIEDLLSEAIKTWWLFPLLVFIGGFGGFIFHKLNPPIYEARAQFSLSLDVTKTGTMTQYEEDIALNTAGHLIAAPIILEQTSREAASRGILIEPADLKKIGVLERRITLWDLRVRHPDAVIAAELANIWAGFGEQLLRESYVHAVEAQRIDRYILALESCLSQVVMTQPISAQCQQRSLPEIQREMAVWGQIFLQERSAAKGAHAGLIIGPVKLAEIPSTPVQYDRNQVVFGGGLIGMVAALFLIQIRVTKGRSQRDG